MNTPITDLLGGPAPSAPTPMAAGFRPVLIDNARATGQPAFPTFASLVTRILNGQSVRVSTQPEDAEATAPEGTEQTSDVGNTEKEKTEEKERLAADQSLGALRHFVERVAAQPSDAKEAPASKDAPASPESTHRAQPAVPAVPAVPAEPGAGATRAIPAVPAVPAVHTEATPRAASPKSAADAIRHRANADPSYVVRDLSVLQPELRTRVERVMERMEGEFGHKVTVVETWRSQSRQDVLFEQGRSRPGQVVTWVKESTHSDGRAADLLVDGKWTNPAAYKRLQQIAAEEGLRTLGMRDRGHVELRQASPARITAAAPVVATPVAPIEFPALTAATQAAPPAAEVVQGAVQEPVKEPVQDHASAPAADTSQSPKAEVANRVAPTAQVRSNARPERKRSALSSDVESSSQQGRPASHTQPAQTTSTPRLTKAFELSPAARLERIAELHDLADSKPMSGMLLRIDNADGGTDRIRLGVQGSQMAASIDVGDSARAASLGERIPELIRALEFRGFEAPSVQLRSPTLTTPTTSAGTGSDAGSRNDSRSSSDDGAFRSPNNQSRQRSRREKDGGNQ